MRTNSPATTRSASAPEICADDEQPAQALAVDAVRVALAAVVQRRARVRARRAPGRPEADRRRRSRRRRRARTGTRRSRTDASNRSGRSAPRSSRDDVRAADPLTDDVARESAEARKQQALGDHLPDEPPAARAERRANGHLALPRRRAHEQQVRDVHAGEQQHEPGDREPEDAARAEWPRAPRASASAARAAPASRARRCPDRSRDARPRASPSARPSPPGLR